LGEGGRRKWEPREMRLCSEYMSTYHWGAKIMTYVRLGEYPSELVKLAGSEEEVRMLSVWRRWVDAVAIYPDRVILIECSIRPNPGKIMQLLLYRELFYKTPELAYLKDLPLYMELVCAVEDPTLEELARKWGVKVVYFRPRWVEDYIAQLEPRKRRGPIQPL